MLMMEKPREKDSNEKPAFFENSFLTDSLGRFHFIVDAAGRWDMILAASKNRKRKNLTISLDNKFSPPPRSYDPSELVPGKSRDCGYNPLNDTAAPPSPKAIETQVSAKDSSAVGNGGEKQRGVTLKEVEVKGKRPSKAADIYLARANSVAYYDFKENVDRLYDDGYYYCDDVDAFLRQVNQNFLPYVEGDFRCLLYHGRFPLVVVDYERTTLPDEFRYNDLPVEWIKSVYISEKSSLIGEYCDPAMSPLDAIGRYGCVVFIETYPEKERPTAAKWGVRKTTFQGYDSPSEFYSPDYSTWQPTGDDYRRTLYWNPMVKPDPDGNVQITFFNNARCKYPVIDAQTVTPSGAIGISPSAP